MTEINTTIRVELAINGGHSEVKTEEIELKYEEIAQKETHLIPITQKLKDDLDALKAGLTYDQYIRELLQSLRLAGRFEI